MFGELACAARAHVTFDPVPGDLQEPEGGKRLRDQVVKDSSLDECVKMWNAQRTSTSAGPAPWVRLCA